MAQVDQVDNSDNSDVVDFTVFGVELPRLSAYAQDVYGCLLNNSLIVKWIYLSLRLHWVVTTPQFDLYIFRVPKWLSSISILERSLLALDFVSTFTQEYIELPSLKTLCWTATWCLVPLVSLCIQTRFTPWLWL